MDRGWVELIFHISILEMKAAQLALDTFRDRIMGDSVAIMSYNSMVVAYTKKVRHCFLRDSYLGRTVHDLPYCMVHLGKEHDSCQPTLSSGPGASN